MTLPASGVISLGNDTGDTTTQSVNRELGNASPYQQTITLNDAAVRTLFGIASGAIDMNTGHGKANRAALSYVFSTNTANASLNVTTLGGYVAGKSDITVTVNAGVWVYATSTANAGLTLTGGTAGDTVTLVNNGYIAGQGGRGGFALMNTTDLVAAAAAGMQPYPGGPALSIGYPITINNTNVSAYIGGGGGGGGGGYGTLSANCGGGGGGAGGGGGGGSWLIETGQSLPTPSTYTGGAGGGVGLSGADGITPITVNGSTVDRPGGGGGGRIFPGVGGAGGNTFNNALTTAGKGFGGGAGGGGSTSSPSKGMAGAGGGGGGWGAAGGGAVVNNGVTLCNGGNGGSGSAVGDTSYMNGTTYYSTNVGAAGGKAVQLNGNTVTWVAGNTTRVYGAVA